MQCSSLYQAALPTRAAIPERRGVSADVQHPDFEPMLFDRLAVEVFEPLGKIATIEDFIESSWGKRLWLDRLFYSILLSRGLEQAKALAAKIDAGRKRSLA